MITSKVRTLVLLGTIFVTFYLISCNEREKDYSLSLDEYAKMGMPSVDKAWDSEDFLYANDVLSKMKWGNPGGLPKKDSKKSGALFTKLISLENLTFLKVDTLALNEKALLLMNYLQIYENWRYIYTDVRLKVQYHHRELIDIQLFGLSIIELMLDYADKIQKSDDPVDIYMRTGDQSIRKMYIDYLLVTLEIQKDMSPYMKEDMERMGDSVSASVLKNKDWMDSSNKSKIIEELQIVIDSDSIGYVRDRYESLSEILPN